MCYLLPVARSYLFSTPQGLQTELHLLYLFHWNPQSSITCERKTSPGPNLRNLFEYFSSWWRTLTKSMVKCGLYNRRCGRDAANEQIVGYAINWLQRYNTLFFVDKQAWRVRWRKRRKNPRPAVKVRFFFCYSGGRSSNFVEFRLGKCQFKDKGNAEVNFAVHVCSKCDSLVYVYSNFWEEKCV